MSKGIKLVLEGEFTDEPRAGKFSYVKTRRLITSKLMEYEIDNDRIFTEIKKFGVEDEGKFTIECKMVKYSITRDSDGKSKEETLLNILGGLEELFEIGVKNYDKEKAKAMNSEGILSVAYFTDLREEED